MGLLRLLLALSVVRDHVPFFQSFWLIMGGVAVIMFYMISGFFMSMVITEKYSRQGRGWEINFLWHRALRLMPCYWAVLALTLIGNYIAHKPDIFSSSLGLEPFEHAWLIFSSLFIVGQDILISGASLHWHDGSGGIVLTNTGEWPIIVAWSIGVEITFYVFAAYFILRNRMTAMLALALAVYFRIYFLIINGKFTGFSRDGIGYSNLPWGYHFFGTSLIFFMFGYLAYRVYAMMDERLAKNSAYIKTIRIQTFILAAIILILCKRFQALRTIADYNDYRVWSVIPFVFLLIPNAFILTRRSTLDAYLGMFSYPIYLCHVLASEIGRFLLPGHSLVFYRWTNLALIAVISGLLVVFIEIPMERVRKRLNQRKKAAMAQPMELGRAGEEAALTPP